MESNWIRIRFQSDPSRIQIGLILDPYWNPIGFEYMWIPNVFRVYSYWIPIGSACIGFLLDSYWIIIGVLVDLSVLDSYWIRIGFLLDPNVLDSYWIPFDSYCDSYRFLLGFILDSYCDSYYDGY